MKGSIGDEKILDRSSFLFLNLVKFICGSPAELSETH